jgi:organic radical activating enzyme
MNKHPMKNFSWYGLKKRLNGRRSYNIAERSGLAPIYISEATLRVFSTSLCNGHCSYCTNLQFPDFKNQFQYIRLPGVKLAQGLNRFYGHYQYYFSGGEAAIHDDFSELINSMYKANIVVMTNLSDQSVKTINKITKNNILLDISYHPHMMELLQFVKNYKTLKRFEKKVHVVEFRDVSTEVIVSSLARYGIKAAITHGVYNKNATKVKKKKTVRCNCTNIHVDPEGGIHTCRARTIMKREPLANIFDENVPDDLFDKFTKCDDYGYCGDCDIIREVYDYQ